MKAYAIQRKPHKGGKWEYDSTEWTNKAGSWKWSKACREGNNPHWKYRVVCIDITVRKGKP